MPSTCLSRVLRVGFRGNKVQVLRWPVPQWASAGVASSSPAIPSQCPAMKVAKACRQCRESKRKCTKSPTASSCAPCDHKQLSCSFASNHGRQHAPILPQPASSATRFSTDDTTFCQPQGIPLPSRHVICELVDLYIKLVHDKPHSLFHEPSIRDAAASGLIRNQVLCGILALSARCVNSSLFSFMIC